MKKLADYEDFINFTIDLLRPFKVRFMIIIALLLFNSVFAINLPKILGKIINIFGEYTPGSTIFFSAKFTNLLIEITIVMLITYIL